MIFSSATFLYLFLPVVIGVYFICPKRLRNAWLLIASLVFYFLGEQLCVLLLVISSISDYLHSLYIESHRGTKGAKIALISSVVINLGMLGVFKYADFFIRTVNGIFGCAIPLTGIALPAGISFFTFQTMSYTIDVYYGRAKAQKNLLTFATFVCLFPQLIAGPIVRYTDIAVELESRESKADNVALGMRRFVFGLAKKVLIADVCAQLWETARASADRSVLFCWLYAISFSLYIYFDFSGYSDMAIGLGSMFGFKFPENFNYPFISRSVTEFWRRWHMTLGGWFRDYVYIPLGGNRVSRIKWLRNIAAVWLLTGLWHGAEWNYVLWGVMYGALLMIEKLWLGKILDKTPRFVQHIYVAFVTIFGFVIFNARGLSGVAADIGGMFGAGGIPLVSTEALYCLKSYAVILVLGAIGSTPLPKLLWTRLAEKAKGKLSFMEPVAAGVLLLLATAFIVSGSFSSFLYWRF